MANFFFRVILKKIKKKTEFLKKKIIDVTIIVTVYNLFIYFIILNNQNISSLNI
jgi:hypothetical protein